MRKSNISRITLVCCYFFLLLIFISCEKDNESSGPTRFEINCEDSSIEGSFVQNTPLSTRETFNLHYTGGGASAKIRAKEINGVYVSEKQIELTSDGSVMIPIEGKPIDLGEFTLKIEVDINSKTYYCSQIFTVAEDTDPTAPITFTMDSKYNVINGLTEAVEIPFAVDPFMASITVDQEAVVAGLGVKIAIDKKTGKGTITLTPADEFIGGTLGLIVSFGARTPVPVEIVVTGVKNVALFGFTASSAKISNLTINGAVTGKEYVAGLVAVTTFDTWQIQFGGKYPNGTLASSGIFYFDNIKLRANTN